MNTDAKTFAAFVRKATLAGNIPTCIVRFGPAGCDVRSNNANSSAVIAHMNGAFEPMTLIIRNTSTFIDVLEQFEGDINIVTGTNAVFVRNEEREASVVMAEESFVENELTADPPFMSKFTADFPVPVSVMKRINTNSRMLKAPRVQFKVKGGVLTVTAGNAGFDSMTEKLNVHFEDVSAVFGEPLAAVVTVLDDSLRVSLRQDFPVRIIEMNDKWCVKYYVAPIIEDV